MARNSLQRRPTPDQALRQFDATLNRLKLVVARVRRPADVVRIRPQLKVLHEVVKQAKLGLQVQNDVAEQALRLERAAGKLLKETVPVRMRGGSKARRAPLKDAIDDLGIHKRTAQRWERVAEIDDGAFEAYLTESKLAEREITTADLLRRFKPAPHDDGPWLWPNWPAICDAYQQARQAIYAEFANRQR